MTFGFASSYIALWLLAIFQGLLTLYLLRHVVELEKRPGRMLLGAGESSIGDKAPKFSSFDQYSGRPIDDEIFAGRGGLILFFSAYCSICRSVAAGLKRSPIEDLQPVVAFCIGDERACERFGKRLGSGMPLILREAEAVALSYQVASYPNAVLVDKQQRIRAHRSLGSVEDLRRLVLQSGSDYRETGGASKHNRPLEESA
jgi:hypothetical protein